jgi:hypothetical protein
MVRLELDVDELIQLALETAEANSVYCRCVS